VEDACRVGRSGRMRTAWLRRGYGVTPRLEQGFCARHHCVSATRIGEPRAHWRDLWGLWPFLAHSEGYTLRGEAQAWQSPKP
jgi:hypothetical protein